MIFIARRLPRGRTLSSVLGLWGETSLCRRRSVWNSRGDDGVAMNPVILAIAALLTAAFGAIGGLGGAVLLVPFLVVTGTSPYEAAPLGLMSVVAGSVAAADRHLRERTVHHRLGVTTELAATAGAVAGALVAGAVAERALTSLLAGVALAAAVAGGMRRGVRNRVDPRLNDDAVGEWVGQLAGAYPLDGGVVPYRARRLPWGMAGMAISGLVSGLAGVGGGFIKTPVTSEIMRVPVKVAASTSTFTVGITAAAALIVMAVRGQIDPGSAGVVVVGALVGGQVGAALQGRLSPPTVRRVLSVLLVAVAVVLVVR
jgi:uncharacterized membrane protein YfcA